MIDFSEIEAYYGPYAVEDLDAAIAAVQNADDTPDATHTDALITSAGVANAISAIPSDLISKQLVKSTTPSLDSVTTPGIYQWSDTIANIPANAPVNHSSIMVVLNTSETRCVQIVYVLTTGSSDTLSTVPTYRRRCWNGTWGTWEQC